MTSTKHQTTHVTMALQSASRWSLQHWEVVEDGHIFLSNRVVFWVFRHLCLLVAFQQQPTGGRSFKTDAKKLDETNDRSDLFHR